MAGKLQFGLGGMFMPPAELSGDWGDALAGQSVVSDCYDIIRKKNAA